MDESRSPAGQRTWFEVQHSCAVIGNAFDHKFETKSAGARAAWIDSGVLHQKILKASPGTSHDVTEYWIGLTRARWISASGNHS